MVTIILKNIDDLFSMPFVLLLNMILYFFLFDYFVQFFHTIFFFCLLLITLDVISCRDSTGRSIQLQGPLQTLLPSAHTAQLSSVTTVEGRPPTHRDSEPVGQTLV